MDKEIQEKLVFLEDEIILMRELIDTQKEYIKLLSDELDEVIVLAYTHGWRSNRYEKGVEFRNKIEELENELRNNKR